MHNLRLGYVGASATSPSALRHFSNTLSALGFSHRYDIAILVQANRFFAPPACLCEVSPARITARLGQRTRTARRRATFKPRGHRRGRRCNQRWRRAHDKDADASTLYPPPPSRATVAAPNSRRSAAPTVCFDAKIGQIISCRLFLTKVQTKQPFVIFAVAFVSGHVCEGRYDILQNVVAHDEGAMLR